jgi:hypothetical protein
MSNPTVVLITVRAILSLVVWFGRQCLADLAQTSDRELRYFDRNVWALIIVLSFPIGPMLYLFHAKGPADTPNPEIRTTGNPDRAAPGARRPGPDRSDMRAVPHAPPAARQR